MGFTRAELDSYRDRTVPDLIPHPLRLLFVGINPGLWTAATGAHFARPGNRFYPALHRAGIDPRRLAGRIGAARIAALVGHIRDVLDEAIAAGGSSLRDHRQASGELGYFQHSFRVYDREDAPCPRPACPGTIRRIVQSGRSSFYCPACQR